MCLYMKAFLKELHEQTTSAYIAAARQGQGKGIDPDVQADNRYLILIFTSLGADEPDIFYDHFPPIWIAHMI